MRKLFTLMCLLFVLTKTNSQAPAIQWQKNFGGSSYEVSTAVINTTDGGFALAGSSYSNSNTITGNHGSSDIVLIKTDSSGNIIWQKSFGGTGLENCYDIKQTPDGGYIVLGSTSSSNGDVGGNHGGSDIWIFKTSAGGSMLWQRCYGSTGYEEGRSIQLTTDSGFIVVGATTTNNGDVSGNHGGYDAYVFKLSATGSIQWQKCYGGIGYETGMDIKNTADGGYIFAGSALQNNGDVNGVHGSGSDFWVVKINNTGTLQWQKCYGSYNTGDAANNITATPDGGYMVSGYNDTCNTGDFLMNRGGDFDARIVKINSAGVIEWTKCYGGNKDDQIHTLLTSDGGYILYGSTASNNNGDISGYHGGSHDGWLVKVNSSGTLQWQQCLGNTGDEFIAGIVETSDKGYALLGDFTATGGAITVPNYGSKDLWMIKLFSDSTLSLRQICPQGAVNLTSNITGANYQWQQSIDSINFSNLVDNGNYSGTTTPTLHLANIPSAWYGYKFKCVSGGNSSVAYTITFANRWIATGTNTNWETPSNWSCGSPPDTNTDVVIISGNIIVNSNVTIRSLSINPGVTLTVKPGYQLTILH